MRADRLVSIVLLLRQRGQLNAATLASELEVSTRTVQRDIDALSAAGVPVYAERGPHGGFALLPGFRTELTGLTADEALASAMLKVVDALPERYAGAAADVSRRLLIDPATDLLARPLAGDEVPDAIVSEVRTAVLAGRRLRVHYEAVEQPAAWRTVDPIGLVSVRGTVYLLATRDGADRTYRLSRMRAAEALDEIAQRPERADLARIWQDRGARLRAGCEPVTVQLRIEATQRDDVVANALEVLSEATEADGRLRLALTFQDARHAEWAVWQLALHAEVLAPPWLRTSLRDTAAAIAARYRGD